MKILRAFQVINNDGGHTVTCTYNEADEDGNITKRNAQNSFYAVDPELKSHIDAISAYIMNRLVGE